MDRFKKVLFIAIVLYMTVIWIRYGDVCMTLIYVTQVMYTINYHIIFFITEIVTLRGTATADVERYLMVHLKGYNYNKLNKLCQNNGFVKQ